MDTIAAIDTRLAHCLEKFNLGETLEQAVHYVVFAGGKRIRPHLCCALFSDLGGREEICLDAALALELTHTASLVHDDLPGVDNDDFRRGKPTCHKQFTEATAIFTGDVLFSAAMQQLHDLPLNAATKVALVGELAGAYIALLKGQQLDVQDRKDVADVETLHRLKTGALFGASCAFAAVLAEKSSEDISLCRQLGEDFGVLFQIVDDYLDMFGDPEARGRPLGSDQKNDRQTSVRNNAGDFFFVYLGKRKEAFEQAMTDIKARTGSNLSATRRVMDAMLLPLESLPRIPSVS